MKSSTLLIFPHFYTLLRTFFIGLAISTAQADEHGFNPALSVVLNGGYTQANQNANLYTLPGFQLGDEASPNLNGFAINETEINIQANIDPYWYGNLTIALHQHGDNLELDLEEGYIRSTSFPAGTSVKAGRFFSGLGYLNHHHRHQWDFSDAPLVYRGLFNTQYLDDGLQIRWVVPADLYWEIGMEAFSGRHFPAAGTGNHIGSLSLFSHLGGDINPAQSWQAGISYLGAKPSDRPGMLATHDHPDEHDHDHEADYLFSGHSDTLGLDAIWKWAPNGNARTTQLTLQGELYLRHENGTIAHENLFSSLNSHQQGAYIQAVYKFLPRWRAGWRFDYLHSHNQGSDEELLDELLLDAHGFRPTQNTFMLDFSPSEFTLFRAQYNHDHSNPTLNNIYQLQFIVNLGAHGAHAF